MIYRIEFSHEWTRIYTKFIKC